MSITNRNVQYGSFHGYGLTTPAHTYSYRPEFLTPTLNLKRPGFRSASQLMRADFTVVDVRGARGSISQLAWYIARGQTEEFDITWPQVVGTVRLTRVTTTAVANAGASSIALTGLGTEGFNGLRVVQFGGHDKLYFLEPFPTISGGRATYQIEPSLISRVASGAAVDSSPTSKCVLVGLNQIQQIRGIEGRGTVTVQESL